MKLNSRDFTLLLYHKQSKKGRDTHGDKAKKLQVA